jgi:hypothetical protein
MFTLYDPYFYDIRGVCENADDCDVRDVRDGFEDAFLCERYV